MTIKSRTEAEIEVMKDRIKFADAVWVIKRQEYKNELQKYNDSLRLEILRLVIEISPKPIHHQLIIDAARDFEMFLSGRVRKLDEEWKRQDDIIAEEDRIKDEILANENKQESAK